MPNNDKLATEYDRRETWLQSKIHHLIKDNLIQIVFYFMIILLFLLFVYFDEIYKITVTWEIKFVNLLFSK